MLNKVTLLSIGLTISITALILIYFTSILILFDDFLKVLKIVMLGYDINPIILSLSFGLLPIWTLIIWKNNQNKTIILFFSYFIIFTVFLVLICVITFLLIGAFVQPPSPLLPEYIIWLPFRSFWNIIFPFASICLPFLILIKQRKKSQNKIIKNSSILDD